MERARRVANYWSWLPAFRAVAETEHLPTAAKLACLTPSALSRSIKLLEEDLGEPLFDRSGGRLSLNLRGKIFLSAVREAMRVVDEGTMAMLGLQHTGPIHLYADELIARHVLLPSLAPLLEKYSALEPHIHPRPANIGDALQQGDIDVAIVQSMPAREDLAQQCIAKLEHDLFVAKKPKRGTKTHEIPLVVMDSDTTRGISGHRVELRVGTAQILLDAVRSGAYGAILPVVTGELEGFHRCGLDGLGTTDLVIAHRSEMVLTTRAETVIGVVWEILSERESDLPGLNVMVTPELEGS